VYVPDDFAPTTDDAVDRKLANDVLTLFELTQKAYRADAGQSDVRCYQYTQARQRLPTAQFDTSENKSAGANPSMPTQDEVYPVVDAMGAALIIRTPYVSAIDEAYGRALDPVTREQASRFANTLCACSDRMKAGVEVRRAVRYAMSFVHGATFIVEPDAATGPVWRLLRPQDVFIDDTGGTVAKAEWAFRILQVGWQDFQENVKKGIYKDGDPDTLDYRGTRPDEYAVNDETSKGMWTAMERSIEQAKQQLFPTVTVIEYYDFKRKWYAHLALSTQRMLMKNPLPYGNPFVRVLLDAGLNDLAQTPFVARALEAQRIINDILAAQTEIATCNHGRTFGDSRLLKNDPKIKERIHASKVNEIVWVDAVEEGAKLSDMLVVTQPAQITPSQVAVKDELVNHIRYMAGLDQFRESQNVRTAEEVEQMVQSSSARAMARVSLLDECLFELFRTTGRVLAWMIEAKDTINYDPVPLWEDTNPDIPYAQWVDIIRKGSRHFKLEPFGSLKENLVTRRQSLLKLIPFFLNPALKVDTDTRALLTEVVAMFRLDPSIIKSPEKAAQEAQAAAGPPGMPGMPGASGAPGAPGTPPLPGPPAAGPTDGLTPQLLTALSAGLGQPAPGQPLAPE